MGSTFRRGSRGLGGFTTVAEGLGKAFSMARAAYALTVTSPALALAISYRPRLKPARTMGRSVIQCEVCSSELAAFSAVPCSSLATRLPVATNVQPGG